MVRLDHPRDKNYPFPSNAYYWNPETEEVDSREFTKEEADEYFRLIDEQIVFDSPAKVPNPTTKYYGQMKRSELIIYVKSLGIRLDDKETVQTLRRKIHLHNKGLLEEEDYDDQGIS